ncbi:hypothetical protein DFH11DRAFT_1690413 [Phellopilus nigrolimitatus]|nr:hypothetical protein DFH11DRAFT_1690413 [Phellopilus nigrolimitatus]
MAAPPPPHPFPGPPNFMALPPLPPGWTEHAAAGGQKYYYNAITKESTYVRPIPTFSMPPFAPSAVPPQTARPAEKKKEKKEKPKVKTPIPGTPWLRVTTTAGHVFYTHTERKESVWTDPEEIKDKVAQLEREEKEKEEAEVQRKKEEEEEHRKVVELEVERIKKEIQETAAGKRKATEEPEPLDEVVVMKKARVEEVEEDEEEDEEEEEEEEWQREAAAQLAAEAEEEERRKKEEEDNRKREEDEVRLKEKEKGVPSINMPNRVDLSIEEAKALFKTLLREKDVNPLLPWDTALPQFISDPRYVLLPSVSARRDAFDEYCRDRARELRQAKLAAQSAAAAEEKKDPKSEFDRLLLDEVKSTRTSWNEWRRAWKKDRRFWGWGRDDREREKRFREWLKELGEQKRKAAQKAEADFFVMLREKAEITVDSAWKDIKRGLDEDPRYDAVGSSSLREELFSTYVKTHSGATRLPLDSDTNEANVIGGVERKPKNVERKERAVKEREEHVKRERGRVEAQTARSRNALSREESELDFLTMLTDAIREPLATWESDTSPHSASKHISALHAIFAAHAPALDTTFSALPVSSIQASLPAVKLLLDKEHDENARALEGEYRTWRAARGSQAEREFQEMLDENAFVEFWGRVRKMKEEGEGGMKVDVGAEDLAGEEGDGEDKIDLKALAKSVDVREIERVLKNDKRYTVFDHIPEQREKWIRAHVEKLAAPKLSVHVPEHGQ